MPIGCLQGCPSNSTPNLRSIIRRKLEVNSTKHPATTVVLHSLLGTSVLRRNWTNTSSIHALQDIDNIAAVVPSLDYYRSCTPQT